MTMSKDRVRFTIPGAYLTRSSAEDYLKLLDDVFGIALGGTKWGDDVTIICRPSQFARFLIERHKRGISNQFAVLNAELFQVSEERRPTIFDASAEPNRPGRLTYGKAPK